MIYFKDQIQPRCSKLGLTTTRIQPKSSNHTPSNLRAVYLSNSVHFECKALKLGLHYTDKRTNGFVVDKSQAKSQTVSLSDEKSQTQKIPHQASRRQVVDKSQTVSLSDEKSQTQRIPHQASRRQVAGKVAACLFV